MRNIAVVDGLGMSGRTGNQLIQVGTTIAMAERRHVEPRIHSEWRYRPFFNLPERWYATDRERARCQPVEECEELADLGPALIDYLQDLRWWEGSIGTIREVLSLSTSAKQQMTYKWRPFNHLPYPGVLHVRRGDNVTNDSGTINCLPESYYRDAMGLFPGVESWCVFTDDPEWARDTFGDEVAHVYEGVPRSKERTEQYATETVLDWIDLELMRRLIASGAPAVLSNSSYALMAAVLGGGRDVAYPSYWYGDVLTRDMGARPDLLFPDWLASGWACVHVDDPNPRVASDGTNSDADTVV